MLLTQYNVVYYCKQLAIRSTVSELVASYLGSRHQFMQLGEVQSEKLEIKSGVSRGSILGLFFISRLHIRRLLWNWYVCDDTNVFFSGSSHTLLQEYANTYLNKLPSWVGNNKLQLNITKTTYILFKPINKIENTDSVLSFNGSELERIKNKGSWGYASTRTYLRPPMQTNSNKCSRSIGCIYRMSSLIMQWLKINLYYSLVCSKISYCI